VFKMEEPRSSKGKLRDQTTKETKEGKFSSFLNWLDLSGSSGRGKGKLVYLTSMKCLYCKETADICL